MTGPSSAQQPEFFADRCLGRTTVNLLRGLGWSIVRISDVYADDAQQVSDEEWVARGGAHGWALLTKDKRIRYQPAFDAAVTPVFALSDGSITIDQMVERFDAARDRIWTHTRAAERQFWIVYDRGRVERRA
jgi:hypothetical protein